MALDAPVFTWYNENHSPITEPFNFKTVDAGDWSELFTFNIWNNKNGSEDAPKAEECTITTRDTDGGLGNTNGFNIPLVYENWFHCQVDSLGETDLQDDTSKIGIVRAKPVGTTGSTIKNHAGTNYSAPITPAAQEILGVNNNGNPADSAGNFVTITLAADVPSNARSGRQDFKLRLQYRYV